MRRLSLRLFSTILRPFAWRKELQLHSRKKLQSPHSGNLSIRNLLEKLHSAPNGLVGSKIRLSGWVTTVRVQKKLAFIEISDGSDVNGFQVVVTNQEGNDADMQSQLPKLLTGCSVEVEGTLQSHSGSKPAKDKPSSPHLKSRQSFELHSHPQNVQLLGPSDGTYPLQKKQHSLDFLREIAHLRPRSRLMGASLRLRNDVTVALNQCLQDQGFVQIHTPIITPLDTEGAGELFHVYSSEEVEGKEKGIGGGGDGKKIPPFFGRPTYLTVSGQLYAEMAAAALHRVYAFGPTFRAENSITTRHLAEFWMLEPEIAFATATDAMDLAENCVKYVIQYLLTNSPQDMHFFEDQHPGLLKSLEATLKDDFVRMTYTEAIQILVASKQKFEFPPIWGERLQSEHEHYLAETHCNHPVFVTDYPRAVKPFYMRANPNPNTPSTSPTTLIPFDPSLQQTVACFDLLIPGVGELVGGSQREERLPQLEEQMREKGIQIEDYRWYLDLRKYGSVKHSGFGMGLERLLRFVSGVHNVRDLTLIPRFSGNATF